ncbi:MAG: EMC3/TMCO1 family protein [Candidatus Hadarchaeales archaeon]
MKKLITAIVLIAAVIALTAIGVSAKSDDRIAEIVRGIDSTIVSLRKGEELGARLSQIEQLYRQDIAPQLENVDNELNQQILSRFSELSLSSRPVEENIRSLREEIVKAGEKLGMSISPIHKFSSVFILFLTFLLSLLVTLANKWVVNWELVSNYQAQVTEFWNEYRDALRKQDRKRLLKLDQRKPEISRMQTIIMSETMKPSIYYLVPLLILWVVLAKAFSGWVVTWLPFSLSLPIYGKWVACGFGWWYFLTFMAFSVLLRPILVPSIQKPSKPQQTEVKT